MALRRRFHAWPSRCGVQRGRFSPALNNEDFFVMNTLLGSLLLGDIGKLELVGKGLLSGWPPVGGGGGSWKQLERGSKLQNLLSDFQT